MLMSVPNSIEQFFPHVGSAFVVHTAHGMRKLNLYSATELPRRGLPAIFSTPVSLLLSGEQDLLLAQDTYVLDHLHLGRVEWMMVPVVAPTSAPRIDMQPTCHYYEVVFS
jgi:hypothetical protein